MTITFEQLIALLPLLIVGLTVVVVMMAIAIRRCHKGTVLLSILGLIGAFIGLLGPYYQGDTEVAPLMMADGFTIGYSALVLIAALATCIFGFSYLQEFKHNREEFYLLVLISTTGGLLLCYANHMATLFLGIELVSVPLFGLAGYTFEERHSLEAAIKYMLLSAAASASMLFGIALLYTEAGSLSFAKVGLSLQGAMLHEPIVLIGLGLLIVGIGFKLSLVPFHLWTPDVYQGSPTPVSAYLATASKIAIFAVISRFFIDAPVTSHYSVQLSLGIIALLSMLFGNVMALTQRNIKRLLGYSSIAHLGYLVVALVAIQEHLLAMETIWIYLVGYLLASIGAFGVVSLMSSPYYGRDTEGLHAYRGLFWHRPALAAVMTVMFLSLAGVPMTLGFIGKFYILSMGVQAHLWWLTTGVVIGSAIGLYYYLRVTVSLYLARPSEFKRDTTQGWATTAAGMLTLVAALLVIVFGLYPSPMIHIAQFAHVMALP